MGGARSVDRGRRTAADLGKLANRSQDAVKSPSLVQTAHRTPLSGHPCYICGTRLYFLPGVWRASQSEGTKRT